MTSAPVRVDVSDSIATVTLNRPERLNAINAAMLTGLLDALRDLATDGRVRVVVLTGAGRGFCAGGDVHDLASGSAGRPRPAGEVRAFMEVDELLHGMPKPTVAAINGPCAGAGLSFALAADLRYAAETAVFTTAFLRVGMSGDHGAIWTATRAIGAARTRELFLLGDRIDARQAEHIGLVHEAVPDPQLAARVGAVAARLVEAPAHAVAAMKANLNDAVGLGFGEYLDRETERFVEVAADPAARAMAQAFVDRRAQRSANS